MLIPGGIDSPNLQRSFITWHWRVRGERRWGLWRITQRWIVYVVYRLFDVLAVEVGPGQESCEVCIKRIPLIRDNERPSYGLDSQIVCRLVLGFGPIGGIAICILQPEPI